jgi:hypothetical protein
LGKQLNDEQFLAVNFCGRIFHDPNRSLVHFHFRPAERIITMKLAICLLAIAVSGCATTFNDRWEPVKPLLELHNSKGDRLDRKRPVSAIITRLANLEQWP